MEVEDGVAEIEGAGFTTIVLTPGVELTQPSALVPETEYVVVTLGQTTGPPLRKVYVDAPDGVRVAQTPTHTAVGLAATEIDGLGLTVTTTLAVSRHPSVEPITVYVIELVGVTEIGFPVVPPGYQLYVVAPFPVRVEVAPIQIAGGAAVAEIVGFGFTVIVIVRSRVQPARFLPVTVYVVVTVGERTTVAVNKPTGFHV